jgi:tripartite ATP-independent transporter DctP family solute receptor
MLTTIRLIFTGGAIRHKQRMSSGRTATALLGLLTLAALGLPSPAAADPEYRLKLGGISVATSVMGRTTQKFADLVQEKSGGRIAVTVFPASQLGDETQLLQNAMSPAFRDINALSNTILTSIDPQYGVTNLPFIFRNGAAVGAFSASETFAHERDALLGSRGLRMLAAWDFPPGNIYVNRPVRSLADLKGLKLRVPPSADFVKIFQQLGANPTPLPITQTYISLQTGVVDGTMGSDDAVLAYKFNEVTKFDINLHYQVVLNNPIVSERFFKSLPKDLQDVLTGAAAEASAWGHQQNESAAGSMRSQMESPTSMHGSRRCVRSTTPMRRATAIGISS